MALTHLRVRGTSARFNFTKIPRVTELINSYQLNEGSSKAEHKRERLELLNAINAIIKESGNSEVLSDKQLQKKIQRLEAPATGNGGRKPKYLIIFVERIII